MFSKECGFNTFFTQMLVQLFQKNVGQLFYEKC
jgi:hypothetical protein